jgi:hypothetical protein
MLIWWQLSTSVPSFQVCQQAHQSPGEVDPVCVLGRQFIDGDAGALAMVLAMGSVGRVSPDS